MRWQVATAWHDARKSESQGVATRHDACKIPHLIMIVGKDRKDMIVGRI
jgi:hypothetical protein